MVFVELLPQLKIPHFRAVATHILEKTKPQTFLELLGHDAYLENLIYLASRANRLYILLIGRCRMEGINTTQEDNTLLIHKVRQISQSAKG